MKKNYFLFILAIIGLLLGGSGCNSVKLQTTVALGLKPVSLKSLSSAEAAQKINLIKSNIIIMKQKFSGAGLKLAEAYGWGQEGQRELVIRRFAPGFKADVEWKYKAQVGTETRYFTGAILDGNLQSAHEIFMPVYWREGERSAMNSGLIWLSQDVFENLTKSGVSTFSFGILNKEVNEALMVTTTKTGFSQSLGKLNGEVNYLIANQDVYLTKAEKEHDEYQIKVNGEEVKVQVIKASNWFGEMLVLNNAQNPLVLKVTTKNLAGGALAGFYDYEITELKGLLE